MDELGQEKIAFGEIPKANRQPQVQFKTADFPAMPKNASRNNYSAANESMLPSIANHSEFPAKGKKEANHQKPGFSPMLNRNLTKEFIYQENVKLLNGERGQSHRNVTSQHENYNEKLTEFKKLAHFKGPDRLKRQATNVDFRQKYEIRTEKEDGDSHASDNRKEDLNANATKVSSKSRSYFAFEAISK
ncbi:hypothetical protein CEXT_236171 [Caerostris extrusa]|uniref:Uncharacterized protein n=1 Tax=Caerostris extrusa TaxID=172846 RepID=A0AAV4SLF8_CAEEX|nr:hypothetical protein CEXT_236171 [Caerostris extrusa]